MADLSITAANVVKGASSTISHVTAGATITAGQAVYKDTTDSNEYKLCDADAAATADCDGIALNGASDGQPLTILTDGDLNPGGTVTVGTVYCVSTTAGGIAPEADLLTGDFKTVIGIGTTASNIHVDIINSGVAEP